MQNELWQAPDLFPELLPGTVHIWRCALDRWPVDLFDPVLNQAERQRAERFHFPLHRTRYSVGRGTLRHLLSRYLNREAQDFSFTLNNHGKPELPSRELRFNVSHSRDLALLAFSQVHDLGVDVEFCRNDYNDERIARLANRFFCPDESRELDTLRGSEKQAAFFRCWTRKEALLKATGEGIAGGLATYRVSLLPGQKAEVLAPTQETGDWLLFDLQPDANAAGALAIRTKHCEILGYDFTNTNFVN